MREVTDVSIETQARELFGLANQIATEIRECSFGVVANAAIREKLQNFAVRAFEIREAILNPPAGCSEFMGCLRDAADVIREIRMDVSNSGTYDLAEYAPDLLTPVVRGFQVLKRAEKLIPDLLEFLDTPTAQEKEAAVALERSSEADFGQPVLCQRAREALIALFLLEAFDHEHRVTCKQIAEKAIGKGADPNSFKAINRVLKNAKFVEATRGCQGGTWLTASGRAHAEIAAAANGKW